MKDNLKKLFKQSKFEELEKELKILYPQIDTVEWNTDYDGDTDLHVVFVKLPYMLPFSGSSYAHFADLDGSIYGEDLETIMSECRLLTKDDIYSPNSNIEFNNYGHDLINRGYDLNEFNHLFGKKYNDVLWEIIKTIKQNIGMDLDSLIEGTFDSFEVILEHKNGDYSFGVQSNLFHECIQDAFRHYKSGKYNHVYVDGCKEERENVSLWTDGKMENEKDIRSSIVQL